jgi:hypothetical protein
MMLPASGAEAPRLVFEPRSGNPMPWKPYWSPDGSHIVFTGMSWENQTWMMRGFLGSF